MEPEHKGHAGFAGGPGQGPHAEAERDELSPNPSFQGCFTTRLEVFTI